MDREQDARSARERVGQIKEFYGDVFAFGLAAAGAGALAATGHGGGWMLWVLGIWALVLIVHAAQVFVLDGKLDADWETRKTRELMERR